MRLVAVSARHGACLLERFDRLLEFRRVYP